MSRQKNKIRSKRISLTGHVNPIRYSEVIDWLENLPNKSRFPVVIKVLNLMLGLLENENTGDIDEIKKYIFENEPDVIYRKLRRRTAALRLRIKIFERDEYRCVICGRDVADGIKLQVDHIKPYSKGGLTDEDNLATLCNECNSGKSDMEIKLPRRTIKNKGSI